MRILGIDPGYERMGVAIIEKSMGGKETVIYSDCVRTSARLSMPERLLIIGDAVSRIITEHHPDAAAIEDLYFAKNTTTALTVAEARGVIQYAITKSGIPCTSYHPNAIKIAVTGYGAAKKEDIAFMIPKLVAFADQAAFAEPAAGRGKLDDELDAIAVALTHLAHSRESYPQMAH